MGLVSCGTIVVAKNLRILSMNGLAREILGEEPNLRNAFQKAQIGSDGANCQALFCAIQNGESAALYSPGVIVNRLSNRPLIVQVFPLVDEDDRNANDDAKPHAMVLMVEPRSSKRTQPAAFLKLLGLTDAETKVAHLVGYGISPKKAATRLGIAEATVRVNLKRVFAKLDIQRQSELTLLLATLAPLG
jgi:DNA-binding CsgD family transcriptional regulator